MSIDYILQTTDQDDTTAWMYSEADADSELAEISQIELEEGLYL